MFEKEIKFIGDFSFNQVRSLGNTFTLDKIIATGIHPAIVQYISAELEYMIYSDRQKLLQQSYFDYTGKEISDHFQKISSEIKKQKKISIDDSKKLIFQAVSFNINYLVRPRWSLTKLIFNEQPVISAEEMKMMLNYLYYYEYFKKVLTGYISKRNLMQISSTEFEIILDKIDNELINSNQRQLVTNSFISIGDFFNIGGVDKNLLPLTSVEIFCKEKNLLNLLVRLRKVIPNDVKRRFDRVEIERILFTSDAQFKQEDSSMFETEIKTDEMINKIDAEDVKSEQEKDNTLEKDEMQKSDLETFLSPEEEEALLSLYSEESKNSEVVLNKPKSQTEEKIVVEEEKEIVSFTDTDSEDDDNIEVNIPESESYLAEESLSYNESIEPINSVPPLEDILNTDKELDELVEAITETKSSNDIESEDTIKNEIEELEETEISDSEIEADQTNTSIEKEIVQEMIEDMYSEKISDTSEIDEIEDVEIKFNKVDEDIKSEVVENKIESLENDLLNIFEGLDNLDLTLPQKGKMFEETSEFENSEIDFEKSNLNETQAEQNENFDDYLNSMDEVVFSEKVPENFEEKAQIKNDYAEVEQKIEEKTNVLSVQEKNEKTVVHPRNVRPKDLFSYLRKKEIKKIVSYIFANDEEDFTNTVERVMDCHSYKEASEILKAVFTSYKISPYSKEAITFTNAVSNYFRQA